MQGEGARIDTGKGLVAQRLRDLEDADLIDGTVLLEQQALGVLHFVGITGLAADAGLQIVELQDLDDGFHIAPQW